MTVGGNKKKLTLEYIPMFGNFGENFKNEKYINITWQLF